jgi:site-specific recombinase XerD
MNNTQQCHFNHLYQQHLNALKRQGKSDSTIDLYARPLRRIVTFFDRCPDTLTEQDLNAYFDALIVSHSWSTVKTDRNGLQFFYKYVLRIQWRWIDIVKPPQTKTLPDILTQGEISHIIQATHQARYQAYIFTTYSLGLRLSETLHLTIADIDSPRHLIHIRHGKGLIDRFVSLPDKTLQVLRQYWVTHRNSTFLFPAGKDDKARHLATSPMSSGGIQKSFKAIVKSCGIHKHVTIHTLRHCYGTHLVEAGLNLTAIHHQMGHQSPRVTVGYIQMTDPIQQNTREMINTLIAQVNIDLIKEH